MTAALKRRLVRDRPGRHVAAIARPGDPEPLGVDQASSDARVDAGEDIGELGAAGVADIEPREFRAPADIAPVVGQEDHIAGRRQRQGAAGIEGMLGGPARAAMDIDDRRQRPVVAVARNQDQRGQRRGRPRPAR